MSTEEDSGNRIDSHLESMDIIDPSKRPGAAAVFEAIKEAKETGVYSKQTHKERPTTFKEGMPKPKKLTLVEAFAEKVGIVDGDRIFTKMKDAALEGDMGAMVFILERMYPKGKVPRHMYTSLHDLITLSDIDRAQTQIIREVTEGKLDIDDANVLFNMIVHKSDMQIRQTTEEMKLLIEELKDTKGVK